MSLMDQIRRATDAKRTGALALAACTPSVEELGDRLLRMAGKTGEEMTEAEALAVAHEIREAMLEVLERCVAGRSG